MINSGASRQVSCAEGFTCVTTRTGGNWIGQQQAMCVRFETSCRDLVGDDDWWDNNNNVYGGMGPNNNFPGVGPGNGNQCNSDRDCSRLIGPTTTSGSGTWKWKPVQQRS